MPVNLRSKVLCFEGLGLLVCCVITYNCTLSNIKPPIRKVLYVMCWTLHRQANFGTQTQALPQADTQNTEQEQADICTRHTQSRHTQVPCLTASAR